MARYCNGSSGNARTVCVQCPNIRQRNPSQEQHPVQKGNTETRTRTSMHQEPRVERNFCVACRYRSLSPVFMAFFRFPDGLAPALPPGWSNVANVQRCS
uniref:Uncharacterized protein n=1 Tax=Anopheles arabiensis TaxID=7173 RepID=A0A8W7MTP7_ANOAR